MNEPGRRSRGADAMASRDGLAWPRPSPLGATWDGGASTSRCSRNTPRRSSSACSTATGSAKTARIALPEYTDQIWHGYLPGPPGPALRLSGARALSTRENGHRFNPHKLLIDPYAKAIDGRIRWSDAHFGYRLGARA